MQNNPDWARYLLQMGETELIALSGEAITRNNREFMKKIAAWLGPHIEAGKIKRLPTEVYLPLITSPCFRFSCCWLAGLSTIDMDQAHKIFADAAWQSLKASR